MDISDSENEEVQVEIKTLKNAIEVKTILARHLKRMKSITLLAANFKTKKGGRCQIAGCNREEDTRRCCIKHHEEMRILFNEISVHVCTRCEKGKSTFTYKICQCCRFSRADAV